MRSQQCHCLQSSQIEICWMTLFCWWTTFQKWLIYLSAAKKEGKDLLPILFVQGGPKVGIQLLNYFLCALKLPAVHFMWPKSRHTVNGENYLEILCEVVVPQLQTKPNFDELFFQKDGTSPHYALRVRDYLNKVFTQRWFGRTGSIEWPPCSPDLTPMDFFFWDVVKNKEYVKNKEKNPKTVNELKDCIYDAFREIDAN